MHTHTTTSVENRSSICLCRSEYHDRPPRLPSLRRTVRSRIGRAAASAVGSARNRGVRSRIRIAFREPTIPLVQIPEHMTWNPGKSGRTIAALSVKALRGNGGTGHYAQLASRLRIGQIVRVRNLTRRGMVFRVGDARLGECRVARFKQGRQREIQARALRRQFGQRREIRDDRQLRHDSILSYRSGGFSGTSESPRVYETAEQAKITQAGLMQRLRPG